MNPADAAHLSEFVRRHLATEDDWTIYYTHVPGRGSSSCPICATPWPCPKVLAIANAHPDAPGYRTRLGILNRAPPPPIRGRIGAMPKPQVVTHQFGPFMVSNRKWGKMVDPYFSIGVKTWPVAQADLNVELEDQHSRITATRVLAGGLLLGPAGMILGALARKDVTKGRMELTVDGKHVQTYSFPGRDVAKAEAFIDALAQAKG